MMQQANTRARLLTDQAKKSTADVVIWRLSASQECPTGLQTGHDLAMPVLSVEVHTSLSMNNDQIGDVGCRQLPCR